MAKNKYELLADNLRATQRDIELFFEEVDSCVASIQKNHLFFSGYVKSHIVFMKLYASSAHLRKAWENYPVSNYKYLSCCIQSSIEKGKLDALLCCVNKTELFVPQEWFGKEEQANSLGHLLEISLKTMDKESINLPIIDQNLSQRALPFFDEVVAIWKNDVEGYDTVPSNPKALYKAPFAPKGDENLVSAYESVRKSLKEGTLRNYEHLQRLWRTKLETLMFEHTDLNEHEKQFYIWRWENNMFGIKSKRKKTHKGRYLQAYTVDRVRAAKILQYFIDRFLKNTKKHQIDGVIACALWTFIWFSVNRDHHVTEETILSFTTNQLNEQESILWHNNEKIEISSWLHSLLLILRGKGQGKRSCKLFPGLSPKRLQNGLQRACNAILGETKSIVSPSAFLTLPHPHINRRISKERLETMRR